MASYADRMNEGKRLRSSGQFAAAHAQFELAAAAATPGSADLALARYFAGLSLQDRDEDGSAIAPFQEALRIYEALPGETKGAALLGAALGLSLVRERRWAEAVRVLEASNARLGDAPENAGSLAAGLHNLAIAWTRGGEARRGAEAARRAVAIHEATSGAAHPLTVETMLIEAFALVEAGVPDAAAPLIRRCGRVILAGAGEAHPFFADALLTEARRQARRGDGGAAEALARRAGYILTQAGVPATERRHRDRDAADLQGLWRTASKAQDADDVALWRVSMQHTLRRYQPETLDFAGSGDRPKEWFFFVPKSWPTSRADYAAKLVFADLNAVLNAREPADAAFLDATRAEAVVPSAQDLREETYAERFRARVWEPSIAYSLVKGVASLPLPADAFARALAALNVPDSALLPLQPDAGILSAARADRKGALESALGF